MEVNNPIIIAIGGGTASGKTTVSNKIIDIVGSDAIVLNIDNYYKSNWGIPFEERKKKNYDHPNAFEWTLLKRHLNDLLNGKPIEMPVYDFTQHERSNKTIRIEPRKVIIIDGIFALYDEDIRNACNIKIYIDTPDDIRFIRRLMRDINERGRTMEYVVNQYISTVRPMHIQFVEPTKQYADIIIPGGFNKVAVDVLRSKIKEYIKK